MLDFSVYFVYRAGSALVALFPLRPLFFLGEVLGFCAWLILPGYRRLAFRNSQIAFGSEKSPRELRRLVRRHFQTLGANLLCGVKWGNIPPEVFARYCEVENADAVHRELRKGRPVILILSHLSCWELLAQILPSLIGYVRDSTVFQKLGNRYIDEHVRQIRGRTGVELFDRSEGFHKAIELLRGGGAIGVLSDQHAGDHGLWTPFFGRLASTTTLPALLAKRTGAALIGAHVQTIAPGRWRLIFDPAFGQREDSIAALTFEMNNTIARQIRAAPEDWFWVHNRWKTPQPNFLLARYRRGVSVPAEMSGELKPFRILVRAPNWLGDAVMSAPTVRAIKAGRPDAHVTVAAPEKNAAMWKLVPEVDEVVSLPKQSPWKTARQLRKLAPFDVAIVLPNSLRSALEVWLARIPRRVGFRGHHRHWLLNQTVPERKKPGPIEHQAFRFARIARNLGADALDFSGNARAEISASTNAPLKIALCPGAEYGPAKRWLPERFAEVALAVSKEISASWILFGTKNDDALGKAIAETLGDKCVNRIGLTSLSELIAELRECRLLLTNDTGTMHLAALVGIPVVAIFGSTEPQLTAPLGPGHLLIRHHVECSPCFLRECPIDFRCMKAVSVEEVTAAVLAKLRSTENEARL